MKRLLVGGPILGAEEPNTLRHGIDGKKSSENNYRNTFEPLVTPTIGLSASSAAGQGKLERFVLLPHRDFIQVLAYKTGKFIANFIPFPMKNNVYEPVRIDSVCLAKYPTKPRNMLDVLGHLGKDSVVDGRTEKEAEQFEDHVALVGCSDGTLREFSLVTLLPSSRKSQKEQSVDGRCSTWELVGPCYGPRRIFKVSQCEKLKHITAPSCTIHAEYGILVYGLAEASPGPFWVDSTISKKSREVCYLLLRILLPPYYGDSIMDSNDIIDLAGQEVSGRVERVDKIVCNEGQGKGGTHSNIPFRLESVIRSRSQDRSAPRHEAFLQQNVFLVIARPTSIIVHCERLSDIGLGDSGTGRKGTYHPISFPISSKNRLTSLSISINRSDIACGHWKGDIVIKSNLLAHVEEYHIAMDRYSKQGNRSKHDSAAGNLSLGARKPKHPSKVVVDARMHWHAHPVTALCYDSTSPASDPVLYSGGNESVLVTWQLSRGTNRPADVLPRLALGGILHLLCPGRGEGELGTNDGILVFCEDNSLHLFECHNKSLLWKLRGLPSGCVSSGQNDCASASMVLDPKTSSATSQLILHGMPGAPGLLQWYNTRDQRVVNDLEVAPYNRVSRMEHNDQTPMPAPSVTHLASSKSGDDLVTIDEVPTENKFVGSVDTTNTEKEFGVVTTIRFWSWNASDRLRGNGQESGKPYDVVAAMVHPHGNENNLSAIAISSDGQYACSVSNEEKAFRLWQKVFMDSDKNQYSTQHRSGRRMPAWVCQYKITTPAGYSNHPTGKSAVAFSSDSSILAVCYGSMITIWDFHGMTLLTCLSHLDDGIMIDSVEFTVHDMVLCKSASGVSLQSPFGTQDRSGSGWNWMTHDVPQPVKVASAQLLTAHNLVAVSLHYDLYDVSRIVFIQLLSGQLIRDQNGIVIEDVPGLVCSIGETENSGSSSKWRDCNISMIGQETREKPFGIYAMTNQGMLFRFEEVCGDVRLIDGEINVATIDATSGSVPQLPSTFRSQVEPASKRCRLGFDKSLKHAVDNELPMKRFGSITEENRNELPLPTSQLPSLSGGFARAFIGRTLLGHKYE